MAILPTTVENEPAQTQQFTQTGIGYPIWTLDGEGALDQTGLYTFPSSGNGVIRVHSSFWASFDSAYFTKQDDDRLIKNTATNGFFKNPRSNAGLNQVGDSVVFSPYKTNPYWQGLENAAKTHRFVYFAGAQKFNEYHPNGNTSSASILPNPQVGDTVRMEIIAGGFIQVSLNGVIKYTTVNSFIDKDLRYVVDADSANGTVYELAKFTGSGITGYTEFQATASISIQILLPKRNLELYIEPDKESGDYSDDGDYEIATDYSPHSRDLVTDGNAPIFKTNQQNGKAGISFDGASDPLQNSEQFKVQCGWMVVKFNEDTEFSEYQGLLTDLDASGILVSNNNGTNFFDFLYDSFFYEFRTNDRIYPASDAPAPMNEYKIIFFRFWTPLSVNGIQIGQDRMDATRKANAVITFLALYSKNFCEEGIRSNTQIIADSFGLSLTNVFPLHADKNSNVTGGGIFNTYKPPEGAVIAEQIESDKFESELSFSNRRQKDWLDFKGYYIAHFPEIPFIYRDYSVIPPVDYEGNFTTKYQCTGAVNDFSFSVGFREI